MRRLLPVLGLLALVAGCAGETSPEPFPMRVAQWTATPSRTPPDAGFHLLAPDDERDAADSGSTLYTAPAAKASCDVRSPAGGWTSMKRYMESVSDCLDVIWATEFEKVGMDFLPPLRRFVKRHEKDSVCGRMPADGAAGTYCGGTATYYVLLLPEDREAVAAAWVAEVVAHEYGHRIQHLAGLMRRADEMTGQAGTRQEKDLVSRRLELQAECFSGVALHAMRKVMPPWSRFQDAFAGVSPPRWVRDHGRLATRLRWLTKGFRSGRPGSCDTWSARPRDVT
ncbi:neutral zinc metallopeptidase [Microbispora sp. NPDC049125]|uniref:neutral zinc metallopeptidase n=1 Tax=Microbispora sp. NPDC049125 TaxID=3154929 RepID=UPI0034656B34